MLRLCSSGCFCEHTWVKPFTVIFNFSLLLSLFQAHSRCLLAVSLTDAQKNTWQETVWRILNYQPLTNIAPQHDYEFSRVGFIYFLVNIFVLYFCPSHKQWCWIHFGIGAKRKSLLKRTHQRSVLPEWMLWIKKTWGEAAWIRWSDLQNTK